MKKNSFVKRIFSIIIAVALLVSAVPVSLAVQNLLVEETTSKIVREVTELREESAKHFLCEDGSYIAATYSAPVHYKENGEWKEIDNSLSLERTTLSKSGKPTYTTKAGGLSVSIPQDFSDGQKITIQNKGYEIGFGVNANQNDVSLKTAASVVELETLSSNTEVSKLNTAKSINNASTEFTLNSNDIEGYNAELMTVDNQSSAVTYEEIMPDTDFEYILTSNSIKENIVVYEPQSEYTYRFDMDFDGLTPVINPDNSISLIEPSNPDETIFFIEAPYMYDSNNAESIDIEMSLTPNGDEYVMTLVANAEWINDPERVFPVIIDPTIHMPYSSFDDLFVIDGTYANSPRIKKELRVGTNLTNTTRTYLKISMPTNISEGSIIEIATLNLTKDYYFKALGHDDIHIQVYDLCRGIGWDSDTISWNNQPYGMETNVYHHYSEDMLDSKLASKDTSVYSFNITKAVQRWVSTGTNNGLLIASSNENSKAQMDFHSSRSLTSSTRPYFWCTYVTPYIDCSEWHADTTSSTSPEIYVTAGKAWTVTADQPWISLSALSGTGTSTFNISVSENTSAYERTGTVTVYIDDTEIGKVEVIQSGTAPYLYVDKEVLTLDYQESENNLVAVTTNAEWNIKDPDLLPDWLTANKNNLGSGIEISVSLNAENDSNLTGEEILNRNVYETRSATITLETGTGNEKEITVVQLNEPLSYFYNINNDGSLTLNSSSEYNHGLATWAMELSYAAYNPISMQFLPGIPSSFRKAPFNNNAWTAKADLESKGFVAQEYNYDKLTSVAAHTIGHRTIEIDNNAKTNNDILTGEIENAGFALGNGNVTMDVWDRTHSIDSVDSGTVNSENLGIASVLNSEDLDKENSTARQLVVVSVRGSVTLLDWIMDFLTQFHVKVLDFEVGSEMVLKSLYGYSDCNKCDGSDEKCPCKGYLANNGITNPIILITGHSMGAAIANLVAAELNEREGQADVYAYTFATPTVKSATDGNATIRYTNIFNILNTNDVVTYLPTSLLLPTTNLWSRHGIDIPLNMNYKEDKPTAMIGLFSHSMAVYMKWMNDNKGITYEGVLEKSSEATARGLLPILLGAACPVGVTIKDSNGNTIAYESQEEGITYPELTDTGVVSWITDEGIKMFFIPSDADASSVEIEAYDYGSMDFAIGTAGTTDATEIKAFNDVSLYPNKEFLVEVSEDILPEDAQLFVTENGEIVGEVTETDPHLKSVTVTHEIEPRQVVSYKTFVTDNTVSSIRFYDKTHGFNYYLYRDTGHGTVVEDGDNLIWTAGYIYSQAGDYLYDVYVESDGNWYTYTNAFSVHIPQEFIDIRTETLGINSLNSTMETESLILV